MDLKQILYPLSINIAIVALWTSVLGHNNTNYFWTNHSIAFATAINLCYVIFKTLHMLDKELDEVMRDSENEKQRPRPITVSDLINCIRAIGKIDVKFINTYNFAPFLIQPALLAQARCRNKWIGLKEPEPLMNKSWCNLDDTNILCDKRNTNNVNYYESNDEDYQDYKLFRKKRVIRVKAEDAMDAIEQEVINEVEIVANEVAIEVETESATNVDNKLETEVSTNVDNKVETEVSTNVEIEGSNKADTKDSEYVVVE